MAAHIGFGLLPLTRMSAVGSDVAFISGGGGVILLCCWCVVSPCVVICSWTVGCFAGSVCSAVVTSSAAEGVWTC